MKYTGNGKSKDEEKLVNRTLHNKNDPVIYVYTIPSIKCRYFGIFSHILNYRIIEHQ